MPGKPTSSGGHRHNPDRGIMTEFMQRRPVPVDRLEISLGRRDLHVILRGRIEGAATADVEVDAGGLDQRVDRGLDQPGLWRGHGDGEGFWQTFALREVEDGEAFQERDCLRFLAGLPRPIFLVVWYAAVGIDDGRAVFALADVSAKAERLAKRQPALDRETVFDHRAPEDQYIDSRVKPASGGISRHGERRLRRPDPPGLDPRHAARLQFADDLRGDF